MKLFLVLLAFTALVATSMVVAQPPLAIPTDPVIPTGGRADTNFVLAGGDCVGLDCCYMTAQCVLRLVNQHELVDNPKAVSNPTQTLAPENGADVLGTAIPVAADAGKQSVGCAFPICAFGYSYDSRAALCFKYRGPFSEPVRHAPYTSLDECRKDYSRASEAHCLQPLESGYRKCKELVGLN